MTLQSSRRCGYFDDAAIDRIMTPTEVVVVVMMMTTTTTTMMFLTCLTGKPCPSCVQPLTL